MCGNIKNKNRRNKKNDHMTLEYLDEFLLKLSTSRLGIRRKIVILKKMLKKWEIITDENNKI